MRIFFLFAGWLFFSACAKAQSLENLNKQTIDFYEKGDYKKAIAAAESSMELINKNGGEKHSEYATVIDNLATLYFKTENYVNAKPYYTLVSQYIKQQYGDTTEAYANHQNESAILYEKLLKDDTSVILYKNAIDIFVRLNKKNKDYFTIINNLGTLYKKNEKYSDALPYYKITAKYIKEQTGDTSEQYALAQNQLAVLHHELKNYDSAEILFKQSINIYENINLKSENYTQSIANLASLYKKINEYSKAVIQYQKVVETDKNLLGEKHPKYASNLNVLAILYFTLGEYEKAEALYIDALNIRREILGENHPDYATSLNNLALNYEAQGKYEKAEPLYIDSYGIRKAVLGDSSTQYAQTLNNLAILYKKMGQYAKAKSLFFLAIDIFKKVLGKEAEDYATGLHNLAGVYVELGEYENAEILFLEESMITKKVLGEEHPHYASSLNDLGSMYSSWGKFEKAKPLILKAMEIWKQTFGENNQDYATGLNNLGILYEGLGEYSKAEKYFYDAMLITKKVMGTEHPEYIQSLYNLAGNYEITGQYEKAEKYLLENSGIISSNIAKTFSILSEKEKQILLTNSTPLLEINNSLLYQYRNASNIFITNNFIQQLIFKSLILADTRKVLNSIENSSDTLIKEILKEWRKNKNILSQQYAKPVASRRVDLKDLEAIAEGDEKSLNRFSTLFQNQISTHIELKTVQANMFSDEATLEFVRFDLFNKKWTDSTIYAAYVLRKTDRVPVFIPLFEEKQLQQIFDSAGTTATAMVNNFYRGVDLRNFNNSNFLGTELYKLIWQPLEPYLKGIKKISYSPAGKLFSVAFQALPVDSNTVVMDKYDLQQYTSTRQVALRTEEKKNIKPTNITLFGNASFAMDSLHLVKQKTVNASTNSTSIYTPKKRSSESGVWSNLPGTAEEVKKIKQLFDENKISTKTFVQTTASEENLKALSGNSPQVLHIATHGFFLPDPEKKKRGMSFGNENAYSLADDPLLRSGLILAGGNYAWSGKTPIDGVEDGIATAYEISQLNLSNTELVVLSACETALGDVKGSEGVFGLQRAFKMAGVKKMIVSLWQVPDKETAELMTAFYTYWMKGKTIEESFSQAQADMRKKYSPFYWAAFVLVE